MREDGSNMFYWHFPAQHDLKSKKKKKKKKKEPKAPLVIWLQGGPGSASIKDVVALNGPYWF